MSSTANVAGNGVDRPAARSERPARAPWHPAAWPLWSIPRRLLAPVLLVEFLAVALTIKTAVPAELGGRSAALGLLLVVCGMAHTEIALRVERTRRRIAETVHVDLSSVWTFAGAVLLPPALAAGVATVVFTHLWWRSWRPRVPVYRHVFSTATVVLACLSAGSMIGGHPVGGSAPVGGDIVTVALLVLAICVYTVVNSALVAGAVAVSDPQPDLTKVLGRWDDNLLELGTLSLGAMTAIAVSINPMLVVLVLPPLVVLHRAVLVHHLEEAANTDGKTKLLNAAAWHVRAERTLGRRRGGACGLLVLDLDHFKAVNDTHGHLAGDHVLVAIADVLRGEVRDCDLIGRFGGEEFVVLVGGADGGAPETVAERIRQRVAALRVEIPTPDGPLTVTDLSVSVGCAHLPDRLREGTGATPDPAAELRELLLAADQALYAAKGAGRNTVRTGTLR